MSLTYDEYIAHFGIKGQKWGQRNYQDKDGSLTPAGKERYHKKKEKPESQTWKAKDAGNLSDEELRKRLTRLQQEKQYKEMTASRATRARKWVTKTAGKVLVATAVGVLATAATYKYKEIAVDVGMLPATTAKPK